MPWTVQVNDPIFLQTRTDIPDGFLSSVCLKLKLKFKHRFYGFDQQCPLLTLSGAKEELAKARELTRLS